jgi:hypothetical protein
MWRAPHQQKRAVFLDHRVDNDVAQGGAPAIFERAVDHLAFVLTSVAAP